MGANLSSTEVVDTSKDVTSPTDLFAAYVLVTVWGCVLYVCAMIFTTCALIDRWMGPNLDKPVNLFSVIAAFLLSSAWPAVLVLLSM